MAIHKFNALWRCDVAVKVNDYFLNDFELKKNVLLLREVFIEIIKNMAEENFVYLKELRVGENSI